LGVERNLPDRGDLKVAPIWKNESKMDLKEKNTEILVLGSGNILFGDDGFGPAVIAHLTQNFELPQKVQAWDVGTAIQEILFDLILSEDLPQELLVIDVMDQKLKPGKIFWLKPEALPRQSSGFFSLHLPPTREMLLKLVKKGVNVWLVCCQLKQIPNQVQPGLSRPVAKAVLQASKEIYKILIGMKDFPN